MTEKPVLNKTLKWFGKQQMKKLSRPDSLKKKSWLENTPLGLLRMLCKEEIKLTDAIYTAEILGGDNWLEVINEAADIANSAMMIADLAKEMVKVPVPEMNPVKVIDETCRLCDGNGWVWVHEESHAVKVSCGACEGSGVR